MTNPFGIKKGIPDAEITAQTAFNFVPFLESKQVGKWIDKHPFSLQASMFRILREQYYKVVKGEIKEEVYIAYFEELFSYELNQQQLKEKGRFEVIFTPFDDEKYLITSNIIPYTNKSSKSKGFGYEFEEGN